MTWGKSYLPRTHLSLTPGTSRSLPTLTRTILCSWRLCPSPGTYATISLPVDRRTNTHLRLAEFGFLGFLMSVFRTTPLACGLFTRGFLFGRIFLMGPVLCIWFNDAPRNVLVENWTGECILIFGEANLMVDKTPCCFNADKQEELDEDVEVTALKHLLVARLQVFVVATVGNDDACR